MNTPHDKSPETRDSLERRPIAIDTIGWIYLIVGVVSIALGIALMIPSAKESHYTLFSPMVGSLCILAGLLWSVAGWGLRRCRYFVYCNVIGVLTLPVFFPVGTILGIYTLVLLHRDETRTAFWRNRRHRRR